jgi:hypothetical protein
VCHWLRQCFRSALLALRARGPGKAGGTHNRSNPGRANSDRKMFAGINRPAVTFTIAMAIFFIDTREYRLVLNSVERRTEAATCGCNDNACFERGVRVRRRIVMRRFMVLLVVGASLCLGGSAMAQGPCCAAPAAPVVCTAPVVTTSCCTRVRVRHFRHRRVCRRYYRHYRHCCR